MTLGLLAYVQYTRPPVREKVHPSIVPQIAPIAYCRSHPMTDDRVPGARDLRYMIEGWGKKAKATSMYYYAFNLAETSSPQPFLAKWGVDVPFALKNNCQYWQPETISTFEVNMQALYMGCRLAWDPKLKPEDVYAEIHAKFYGAAAKEMDAYWRFIDDVWVNTPEYSGCGFGHLRRWSPERMAEARRLLNLGIAACKSPMEAKRVQLANDSFTLFESFMKLRRDQAEGKFIHLAEDADAWRKKIVSLGEQYKDQYCFTRVGWTPHTVAGAYFSQFYQQTYNDASRIAKAFTVLANTREFRYRPDPEKKGEAAGWMKPDFADKSWEATDVCHETWSTLGLHDYFKSVWYRTSITLPEMPKDRGTYLWLGSFDGTAKLYVNGQLVKHKGADGKLADDVTGYCQPFSFDISAVAKPGANSIAIFTTRKDFNELGTGGLLAPIMVYAEPPRKWVPSTATAVPFETAPEGEGYFSIIEGKNGKLYVGTHANGVNSWLVEFDPKTKAMKVVVDCHKAIGKNLKGFGSQAKIHTRNNVGASGKIYFGTKQGYPEKNEKREDYPGGYPMVYDPATGETKVYPIPVKHHGINSITPDESRGIAYISTCSDGRPGPGENSIFLILDLKTGKYRELIDTKHVYGFIVLDHLGRAYHPLNGGDIARYDPKTDKLERLKQTIDGVAPPASFHFADQPSGHPINWDVSPDGKTLYSVAMSTNKLFAYDLTASGDTLPGKDLGPLVPTATDTDCRAMCVGPTGKVWISVTHPSKLGISEHHLVSYTPGDKSPARSWPREHRQSRLHEVHRCTRQSAAVPQRHVQDRRWSDHESPCDARRVPDEGRRRVRADAVALHGARDRPGGSEVMLPSADDVIHRLGLEPHPVEGGFFRETYRSPHSSAIYFLLKPGQVSELHVLPTDEVWHFHLGGVIRMLQLLPDGTGRTVRIGANVLLGEEPQVVVPGGVWQGSRLEAEQGFALVSCTMAPPFEYSGYRNASRGGVVRKVARMGRGDRTADAKGMSGSTVALNTRSRPNVARRSVHPRRCGPRCCGRSSMCHTPSASRAWLRASPSPRSLSNPLAAYRNPLRRCGSCA